MLTASFSLLFASRWIRKQQGLEESVRGRNGARFRVIITHQLILCRPGPLFFYAGAGTDVLWGEVLRSSKERKKERSSCHFAFWVGKNTAREFWIVFPHLGCGGDLGMDEKERGVYIFSHSKA